MDNPLRGILCILGATAFFSFSDAMSKLLGADLPAIEITFLRYIVFVVLAGLYCRVAGVKPWPVASIPIQIIRGLGLFSSAIFFIEALRHLPLADAASIGFISPLLITALSVPMLGEIVGIRRWAAIIVGFIGVLVVIRPGTGAFRPEALWVLASSSTWAVASVLTRRMAGQDHSATTLFWSACTGLLVVSCMVPFAWVPISLHNLLLCIAYGVVSFTGQSLMVMAYRYATASTIAPFNYVQLAYSTSLGFFLWGTLPDGQTWLGTAIIVASGIYTVHRERVRARERKG